MLTNYNPAVVRVTHTPTGIMAECSSERSQHRNRAAAFNLLRARLWAATNLKKPEGIVRTYTQEEP